jgi:hypothetical protein
MFHVERHPIQEAPAQLWPTRNQVMNLWIYYLQRQRCRQSRSPAGVFPTDPDFESITAISNANVYRSLCPFKFTKKHKILFPVQRQVRG